MYACSHCGIFLNGIYAAGLCCIYGVLCNINFYTPLPWQQTINEGNCNITLCSNNYNASFCPAGMAKGCKIVIYIYNPLPRASNKIQLLGLGFASASYFACSHRKWAVATTYIYILHILHIQQLILLYWHFKVSNVGWLDVTN